MMEPLFSSDQITLRSQPASHYREELRVSSVDSNRFGIRESSLFCILSVEPLFPGPPEQQFAVQVVVDPNVEQGVIKINQLFLDEISLRAGEDRYWSVRRASVTQIVSQLVFEMVLEPTSISREIEALKRERRSIFDNRCLLVEPGRSISDLSFALPGRGYFNIRSVEPALGGLRESTVLIFNQNTRLDLFVPHRKGGVDMVIVVDASGSMDLRDYLGSDNKPHTRLEGVRAALEILFQRRLASGSRVSRLASVVFGANTRMLYPPDEALMVELRSEAQLNDIRTSTRNLSVVGLDRLKIDRSHTDISGGLQYAAELLGYYSQEGNEKMIVLLSDGANWTEDAESASEGEIISTSQDPAVLADSLHFDSNIRIHTIAISNEQALRRYEDSKHWNQGYAIPNTKLLQKIADFTEGLFFERPDARVLAGLFDEIGEGALYPL